MNIILNIVILGIGIYLISYIRGKANNLATLEDVGKITQKVEAVKKIFNTQIEELKSELQKINIAYQIHLSELTKIRFERIDKLYEDLSNLQFFTKENMFFFLNDKDYKSKKDKFKELYDIAEKSRCKCNLYITQEIKEKIITVMNGAFTAYTAFIKLYNSDTKQFKNVSIYDIPTQVLMAKLRNENVLALFDLSTAINDFPNLLNELEDEFKKRMILKNLE